MIEIYTDHSFKNSDNQVITKVKSIIITTDKCDIILTPCKDATISLTTTETSGSLGCSKKKEATIETQYDNIIIAS